MQPCTWILTAFTLSAGMAFGAVAMADDLPREGTFSGVPIGHGTYKAIPVGKERMLLAFNDYSAAVSNGLADHITWNCYGLGDYAKGVGHDHGYCVGADPSGDQLAIDWIDEDHTLGQKSFNGSFTFTTGTGKFAGISGGGTYAEHGNEFRSPGEGTYITQWPYNGSYKLP